MENECDSNDSVHCYGIICLLWSHFFFFQWYTLWIEQTKEAAREGIFMQCDKYIHKAGWCRNASNLEVLARRWVVSHDCSWLHGVQLPVPGELSYLCLLDVFCFVLFSVLGFFLKEYWGWDRICSNGGFPGGSIRLPMQEILEMQVQGLGQEDPLEKEMTTHSSIPAWEIPRTEEPGGLPSMWSQKSQTRTWLSN